MPERDPDELLHAFERVTADVSRPAIPSPRRSVVPRLAVATVLVVVLAAVAGAALVYGPRLVPPAAGERVQLPTHRDLDAYPAALLTARLVRDGDCVYAASPVGSGSTRHLVVWPSGTFLLVTRDETAVMGRDGKRIAAIGEPIELGGGEISSPHVETLLETDITDGCAGPYWLAASARSPLGEPRTATWRLMPVTPVGRQTTRLSVMVTEQDCDYGVRLGSAVSPTQIEYRLDAIVVTLSLRTFPGECPGDENSFELVSLDQPLGDRQLIDGGDQQIEWQPQEGLMALPQQRHPEIVCYPSFLEGAFLAGDADDPSVAWVVSENGQRVNVLWPVGYTARFTPEIELIGPIGQLLARSGDLLTLGGGFMPSGEFDTCEVHVGPLDIGGDPQPWPGVIPQTIPTPTPIATRTPLPTSPLERSLVDCEGLEVPPFREGGADIMDTNLDSEAEILELTIYGRGDESTKLAIRYTDIACLEHPVLGPIIRHVLEDDTYQTSWTIDDEWLTGASTTTIHVLVTHEYCANDPESPGFIFPPTVTYEDRILITMSAVRDFLPYLCDQTRTTEIPAVIELDEPLGERALFDGGADPVELRWAASLWPDRLAGVLTSVDTENCRGVLVDAGGAEWEVHWPHFVYLEQRKSLFLLDPTSTIAREGDRIWIAGNDVTATDHTRFCAADHFFDAGGIIYVEAASP